MKTDSIMQKACAIIAIIDTEGQKNHGIVFIRSSMQLECARIVILTTITKKKGKNRKIRKTGAPSNPKSKSK